MSNLLLNKAFREHCEEDISHVESVSEKTIYFKQKAGCKCIEITDKKQLYSNYYIGIDWLIECELAVYVAPKLNSNEQQTDYLKMLFSCLTHSDIVNYIRDLYEIKFDDPFIEIEQKQDLITPLLVLQFLQLIKIIVRKGLKKSYYRIEQNLKGRLKGKILVSQTLKQNILKNKPLNTFCQYDEYGVNSLENKILKKTLVFVQKYLALFPGYFKQTGWIINYCQPAFHGVDEHVNLNELKNIKTNSFFKEYKEALHISSLILRRFGYNINEIDKNCNRIKVPPFWIDMSKLFELYILGLLKDCYYNGIKYQVHGTYGNPDFILVSGSERIIIDAKYKTVYQSDFDNLRTQTDRDKVVKDIRQLSGYSRDIGILKKLGYERVDKQNTVVDCLIIYPDSDPLISEKLPDDIKIHLVKGFLKFYKMPIRLPQLP